MNKYYTLQDFFNGKRQNIEEYLIHTGNFEVNGKYPIINLKPMDKAVSYHNTEYQQKNSYHLKDFIENHDNFLISSHVGLSINNKILLGKRDGNVFNYKDHYIVSEGRVDGPIHYTGLKELHEEFIIICKNKNNNEKISLSFIDNNLPYSPFFKYTESNFPVEPIEIKQEKNTRELQVYLDGKLKENCLINNIFIDYEQKTIEVGFYYHCKLPNHIKIENIIFTESIESKGLLLTLKEALKLDKKTPILEHYLNFLKEK